MSSVDRVWRRRCGRRTETVALGIHRLADVERDFRDYLSVDEFRTRFAPTDAQIAARLPKRSRPRSIGSNWAAARKACAAGREDAVPNGYTADDLALAYGSA